MDWFWIIGVGLVLFTSTLGAMFNVFMLTCRERISKVTLEFGMTPRPLPLVLLPKLVLALVMGLLFGTLMMGVLYLWSGISPGSFLWPAYLVAGGELVGEALPGLHRRLGEGRHADHAVGDVETVPTVPLYRLASAITPLTNSHRPAFATSSNSRTFPVGRGSCGTPVAGQAPGVG
ncbi:MAG: hypothetical protein ACYC3V_09090 [Chloroflexota bacterium]